MTIYEIFNVSYFKLQVTCNKCQWKITASKPCWVNKSNLQYARILPYNSTRNPRKASKPKLRAVKRPTIKNILK